MRPDTIGGTAAAITPTLEIAEVIETAGGPQIGFLYQIVGGIFVSGAGAAAALASRGWLAKSRAGLATADQVSATDAKVQTLSDNVVALTALYQETRERSNHAEELVAQFNQDIVQRLDTFGQTLFRTAGILERLEERTQNLKERVDRVENHQ